MILQNLINKIDAAWILGCSANLRLAFLQGWSDGDGCVSSKSYYYSISTHCDHDFAENLLNSFAIGTYTSKTYIRTDGFESVLRAAELPPFKYARDRNQAMEKTKMMILNRRRRYKSNPLPKEEIEFMKERRREGCSYASIGEKLYDEYGYTLDARDIWRLIKGSSQ